MTIAYPTGHISYARTDRARFIDQCARGSIAFAAQPSNNDTVAIAGTTVTFKTSGATGNQVNLGGSLEASLDALIVFLKASEDDKLVTCSYAKEPGASASGSIAFAAKPANNDTIAVAGTTVTFKTSGATGNQLNIGADADATLDALVAFLSSSSDTGLKKCIYGKDAPTKASGTITFSDQPSNNDTIAVGGVTVTFKSSGATGNQVNIGADLAATLTALAAFLGASESEALSACTYAADATKLTVTAKAAGVAGNAIALAASAATASGSKLAGGKLILTIKAAAAGAAGNAITTTASAATASGSTLSGGTSRLIVTAKAPGTGGNALALAASVAAASGETLAGGTFRRQLYKNRTATHRYGVSDRSRWATRFGNSRWLENPNRYYAA